MKFTDKLRQIVSKDCIIEILRKYEIEGYDVDAEGQYGSTALMLASAFGHKKTVEKLILFGANVNSKNKCGNTPLMFARNHHKKEIMGILKKAGAKE